MDSEEAETLFSLVKEKYGDKITEEELDEVKKAVRSSPAARESFRKYLEKTVSEQVQNLIEQDKSELESLGVVERGV